MTTQHQATSQHQAETQRQAQSGSRTTSLPMPPRAGRARVAVTWRLLEQVARRVPVDLVLPDGSLLGREPGAHPGADRPQAEILRPDALLDRMASEPKMAFGEGYMAGDWRPAAGTDLAAVLLPFAQRQSALLPAGLSRLRRLVSTRTPSAQRNSPSGARRNIAAHYDLSNDLFAAFLDETMTYSSARFDDDRPWGEQTLAEAQLNKVNSILDMAGVREGSRVLEIGTGWGTLAIEAARRRAHVTTLTLSAEQAAVAAQRVAAAGLSDRVEIRLQDYREVEGTFDAVVSVEMIEAVGEEFWPVYFGVLDKRLAPGGVAAIQAILVPHARLLATRDSYSWVQKHIFPGGIVPSMRAIEETAAQHTDLRVVAVERFGRHYAETLRRWRATFNDYWDEIEGYGFDETFRRMWEYYLAGAEAGFDADYLDVAQIRLVRPEQAGAA